MNAKMLTLGAVTLLGAGAAVVLLTRPVPHDPRGGPSTQVERLPGELQPLRDEAAHYAPGSPAAVSETFLRAWWRSHYEVAEQHATGEMRRRCRENLAKTLSLPPDLREQMRQVQVIAEAAAFDLERAVTTELSAGDGGVARREVRGEVHAHGSAPDGRPVESRRPQVLELELVDGAWKVSRWTPLRADGGITVGSGP